MKHSKLVVITCLLILLSCKITKENKTLISAKKNVLFLMMDDLRPELSVYGHSQISSPNIDALAKSGVTFKRARGPPPASSFFHFRERGGGPPHLPPVHFTRPHPSPFSNTDYTIQPQERELSL